MKRLIAKDLINKQNEIEELYNHVEEDIMSIRSTLESIETLITQFINNDIYYIDSIKDAWNDIYNYAEHIRINISNAKDIGIYNEDQLKHGNSIIESLDEQLQELQSQLDNHEIDQSSFQIEIDQLEEKINETQILIDQLPDDIEASAKSRLKSVLASSFVYICSVHDSIISDANMILSELDNLNSVIEILNNEDNKDTGTVIEDATERFSIISSTIDDYLTNIEGDMSIGLDMNERMGNGIENKINLIHSITNNIEEIMLDIDDSSNLSSELESIRDELEYELNRLEELL